MADIREQDLALKTTIADTDWIRLVTPTGNHRMTVGQFKDLIGYTQAKSDISQLQSDVSANANAIVNVANKATSWSVANPLTSYKSMTDGSLHIGWQWSPTTGANWPVTTTGFNMLLLARGNADYGFAIAIMSTGKTYTATLRDSLSTITWQTLN